MQAEDSLCKRCGAELRKDRALLKQRQISQNDHDLPAWSNMENAVSSGNSSDDSVSTNFTTASASWDELHSYGSSPLFESHIVKTPENVESCLPNMLEFDGQEAFPLTRVEYQLARLTIQYHALVENYNNSLNRLQQAEANVDNLRKENLELQASNMELAKIFDMRERHIQRLTFNSLPSLNNNVQIPLDSCSLLPSRPFNSNHIGCPNLVSSSGVSSGMCGNESSSNNEFSAHGLSSGLSIVSCQAENNPMLKPKCKMNNSTADNSPTSVLSFEDNTHEIVNTNLFPKTAPSPQADSGLDHRLVNTKPPAQQHPVLPKSISIRSAGFLNMKVTNTPRSDQQKGTLKLPPQKLLLSKPVPVPSSNRPGHRLRLPATKETAPDACISTDQPMDKAKSNMVAELEYDVYSQGMFKTELCNKWQDTGTCPYGDRCQFAHGIEELRPVIRHPRYKTELCRMVAAGDKCPYGHRCHFRHSLSKEEKATLL